MKLYLPGNTFELKYANEEPLRLELYSSEQMYHHSQALAGIHQISKKSTPDRLLTRLADNEKTLLEVHNLLTNSVKEDYQVTPAGEWLLDNFYLIEDQVQIAKRHLPKLYSEGLPQLSNGVSAGLPRVYDIALEIVSHSDGRLDMEAVSNFIESYQSVTHLQIGELWAVPIMLRLALLENLRRVSAGIAAERVHRNLADYWAKQMVQTVDASPRDLILVLADMARSNPPMERSFVAEMIRQLSGKGPTLAQVLAWLEDRLSESGYTSSELVQAENQKQAADQLTVSNSINSLRSIGTMDWKEFVEINSVVEHVLRAGDDIYPLMDFATRDRYRHVVEAIAKRAKIAEVDVAKNAIKLSSEKAVTDPRSRFAHVGYYLIGAGLQQTEMASGVKTSIAETTRRFFARRPLGAYLTPIALLTFGLTVLLEWEVYKVHKEHIVLLIAIAIVTAISASQLAVAIVNFFCTLWVRADMLPKMDFAEGIPEDAKTMVAVPCMITSTDEIERLIEAIEIRYLANKEANLYFGLLTDYKDAPEETMPQDELLLKLTVQKIENLNHKYSRGKGTIFYLFHRPRLWNPIEKVWMGYERKRGKLGDLNSLLRGGTKDKFSTIIGDQSIFSSIKYILTLDADTQLPRDAAWQIVATMAHPLNRAVYDAEKRRVTEGYGILQPRVSISLPRADSSHYARMNGNEAGIDPYTRVTSDVYQDLFQEGSFIGKGIYEVDIFEEALRGRFPENRILSHDLLEGCYTRSGLLSDVQLYEKYPSLYSADMKRRHRWIRGDWQIATWCLPWVVAGDGRWHKNPLSGLSKWKIFDNLRRSLFPAAVTALIILSWMLLPDAGWWTLVVSGMIIFPALISNAWNILRKPKDVILIHHAIISGRSAGNAAISSMFTLICLPYEACVNLDAIFKSCWRIIFSKKKLLEWNPSGFTENNSSEELWSSYLSMAMEPLIAIAVTVYLFYIWSAALYVAGPILIMWLIAPFITWAVSKPVTKNMMELSYEQNIFLQKLTRKTWAFFEEFVTQDDNWLPPDNYQEQPIEVIAHRTSPTNIGLSLLGSLTAYDFSYITMGQMLERVKLTLGTMEKMERFKGHFYNWYDTQTLSPLTPRYVSSVDSGNLGGHLITLKQGLIAVKNDPIVGENLFEGLRNTLRILADTVGKKDFVILKQFKTELETVCANLPSNLVDVKNALEILHDRYQNVEGHLQAEKNSQTFFWREELEYQILHPIEELKRLAPWLYLEAPPEKYAHLAASTSIPTLLDIAKKETVNVKDDESAWLRSYNAAVAEARIHALSYIEVIENLCNQCEEFADMEWDFLYDKNKRLLTIGYNADDHRADGSYYDLLASEVRLGIFLAIAQGKIPQESWFALGRLLVNVDGNPILLSWSGSMFEYLMPTLVMPTYDNTLINQTDKSTVQRQIQYGKERGVPWGISESCYNTIDASQNYQYKAFGVPGLGLKRGLGEDLVIAPYASVMGLMVAPDKSCSNLQHMATLGFEGKYGMYESIDYTASRLPRGQSYALVQSFMAHHQGMSLLSLSYLLLGQPMQKRFEAEPQFQATLLLLEERIPKATSYYAHTTDTADAHSSIGGSEVRVLRTANSAVPEVQLLSNGKYHVMVTNAGGGYSKWKDLAVTRWREDSTSDNWGTFCYLRDLETGAYSSTVHQPTLNISKNYEAAFSQGRADFRDRQNDIEVHTEIVVSPEDDIEMRRISITNRSGRRKFMDITSYAEVVIAMAVADAAHPAFSNLFVQTEILNAQNAILCSRRPRGEHDPQPWMFHLMKIHGKEIKEVSYETDRSQFIGRGNTPASPRAMSKTEPLSGTEGPVLDPIVSIRYQFMIEENETVTVDMLLGMADTREACLGLVDKYQDKHHKDRVFELAWTHNQVVLRQINATEAEAQLYSRMAGSVLYINPAMRAEASVLIKNRKGQSGLWPYSISGDLPIVLLRVEENTPVELIKQLIMAHTFWKMKGLAVDLVIWNESHGGYRQALQNQIMGLIATQSTEQSGGIFVRGADQVPPEDTILMQTVARICIYGSDNSLAEFINRKGPAKTTIPYIIPTIPYTPVVPVEQKKEELQFANGLGGFSKDGKEYIITVSDTVRTPAPWVNVLANPNFGTVISESGQSYTWSENAHEFRLTPWNNDPVSDEAGEAFYIRDEETGHYWSATPLPRRGSGSYRIRHGFGYSVFEHTEAGIQSETWVYVDIAATIKFTVVKLKNLSGRPRKISVTGYTEWVLGDLKPRTSMYISTEQDIDTGALIAKNPYSMEFSDRVGFFDTDETVKTFTGSRTEFIGRNFTLRNPDAMLRLRLSGKLGIGADPCAAIQATVDLSEYQDRDVIFKLGAGKNYYDAVNIIKDFRGKEKATESLNNVRAYWERTVSAITIDTPDPAVNVLANGWLVYQALSCRIWGRSGFYQSGGAFGFRDQLQDVMSLLYTEPDIARRQIVLCASKQFKEGDVMHWWHPPGGRGVRTHCSDDYLWLAFVACRYISSTGDMSVLDEVAPFLEGRILSLEEESNYDAPAQSNQSGTVYEHCVRAIKYGLRYGERGLPLMGRGDWNDGMDQVGKNGKGESVWLAFFLYDILIQFQDVAAQRNDTDFAAMCEKEAKLLQENIEKNAWDGEWYRRAYFDDGTPLGAAANEDCRIDSIAQSWSVISGAGDKDRRQQAMDSAYKYLVKKDNSLIKLLTPPFDKSHMEPGYIKGYVPGVRENGGQYTHAAVWLIMAFAKLGRNDIVSELLTMINPVNHGSNADKIAVYKVEPYVIAGDVYAQSHVGMGGWTWYSGSAGWFYRLIIESVIGLRKTGNKLRFEPCIPDTWTSFCTTYRYIDTTYTIAFTKEDKPGEITVTVDGVLQAGGEIHLQDDRQAHSVTIILFANAVIPSKKLDIHTDDL